MFFFFSANEKRAFLLFYCLPLLFGRLEDSSFLHLAFLVGGIYRLLKDSISKADIEEAGAFLKLYCAQAPRVYGENEPVLIPVHVRFNLSCSFHCTQSD